MSVISRIIVDGTTYYIPKENPKTIGH